MVGKICCVLSVLILAPDYEYIWKLSWLSSQQHIKWPNSGWVPVKTPSGHHCEKSKTTWHLKSLNPQKSGLNSRCSDLNRLRFTVYSLLIIKFSCIYSCPRFSCKIKRLRALPEALKANQLPALLLLLLPVTTRILIQMCTFIQSPPKII